MFHLMQVILQDMPMGTQKAGTITPGIHHTHGTDSVITTGTHGIPGTLGMPWDTALGVEEICSLVLMAMCR